MSISKVPGRQYPLRAKVPFTFADFVSGTIQAAIDLPGGAIVTGGALVITTVFNSGTSDTLTVGDVGGTEDLFASAVDGQAAALTALTLNGGQYTVPTEIGVKWTGVSTAPTTGAGYLEVEYIIDERANEAQPG